MTPAVRSVTLATFPGPSLDGDAGRLVVSLHGNLGSPLKWRTVWGRHVRVISCPLTHGIGLDRGKRRGHGLAGNSTRLPRSAPSQPVHSSVTVPALVRRAGQQGGRLTPDTTQRATTPALRMQREGFKARPRALPPWQVSAVSGRPARRSSDALDSGPREVTA